jgi:hypothetical protein
MKVILTESQVERLKTKLNEGLDSRYNREIAIEFDYYKAKYKGLPIDYISPTNITVSFDINIDSRSWGIKSIDISGVSGPKNIEVKIQYYGANDEEFDDWYEIQLDWERLITSEERNGLITVGDIMEVTLGNDADGRLIITKMDLPLYTL